MEKKNRLAYVDFMKGFCILLIVAFHIDNDIFPLRINLMLQSFRIPMYYFLSGMFFKTYDGFGDFVRRKANNIIVPYVFFMLLTCVVHCVMWYGAGASWMGEWEWNSFLDPFCRRYYHYNTPLWFLISLFEVNVLYYVLLIICPKRIGRYALIMLLAFVAWYFRKFPIFFNAAYLDTVLMAMPYFVLGSEVKNAGFIALNKRVDRWGWLVIVPLVVMLYYTSSKINLLIQSEPMFYKLYVVPFVAILGLFWFSKNLPKLPIITFIGRYSIVVLGTHIVLIKFMRHGLELLWQSMGQGEVNEWLIYAAVVAAELCVIPLFVRLFPKFTAQEPLIKPRASAAQ
ncbi:MAG: acyltransferase family protein [Muribaculaceae bacterium]